MEFSPETTKMLEVLSGLALILLAFFSMMAQTSNTPRKRRGVK